MTTVRPAPALSRVSSSLSGKFFPSTLRVVLLALGIFWAHSSFAGIKLVQQASQETAPGLRAASATRGHIHGFTEETLRRWESLGAANCVRATSPATRALSVGIGVFQDDTLPALSTDTDLEYIRRALEARTVSARTVVRNEEATRARLETELTRLLEASNCGDRIVLTWSGMGRAVPWANAPRGQLSLMAAHDAELACESGREDTCGWITEHDIADFVVTARNRGIETLLFMDACHGLDLGEGAAARVWTYPEDGTGRFRLQPGAASFAAFFAATADSYAYEVYAPESAIGSIGAFTFAYASALQDASVRTPRHLAERIVGNMRELVEEQTPIVMASDPDLPLFAPRRRVATRSAGVSITLERPSVAAGGAASDGEQLNVRGRIMPAEGLRAVLIGSESAELDASGNFRGSVLMAQAPETISVFGVFDDFSVASVVMETADPPADALASPLQADGSVLVEFGQDRDFEADRLTLKSYALLIGNSNYEQWATLDGVPGDIDRLERALLADRGGFDEVVVHRDLDADGLETALEDFFDAYGYRKESELVRLFVYFAGHGHTFGEERNREGYIVPVDAPSPNDDRTGFRRKAMHFSEIGSLTADIDAQHVLFLFDSCFAGRVVQGRSAGASFSLQRMLAHPSLRYITAGGADEEVPDPSTFSLVLAEALGTGAADANGDGHTTGAELAVHLEQEVPNRSGDTQPQTRKALGSTGSSGEFIFFVGKPSTK